MPKLSGLSRTVIAVLALSAVPLSPALGAPAGGFASEPEVSVETTSEPVFDPRLIDAQPQFDSEPSVRGKIAKKRQKFMKDRYERRVKFISELRQKGLDAETYQEKLTEFHRKETERLRKFQQKQFKKIQKEAGKGNS